MCVCVCAIRGSKGRVCGCVLDIGVVYVYATLFINTRGQQDDYIHVPPKVSSQGREKGREGGVDTVVNVNTYQCDIRSRLLVLH